MKRYLIPLSLAVLTAVGIFYMLKKSPPPLINQNSIAAFIARHGQPPIIDSKIDLSLKSLTSLTGIDQLPASIAILRLSRNHLTSGIIMDRAFAHFQNLQTLFLDHNRITSICPAMFDGLAHLEKLYLNNNEISVLEPGSFHTLGSLKKLFLSGNRLREIPVGVFDGLDQLQELYLYGNQLSGTSEEFLQLHFPARAITIAW